MNLLNLRFLTDENIDIEVLHFLRAQGFDVFDIKEKALFQIPFMIVGENNGDLIKIRIRSF